MLCRIQHIGERNSTYLSLDDFTLAPGFTSPDFELVEGSPEEQIVNEWVQEGLVKILPPSSTTAKAVGGAGGRSKGRTMTAEEVRESMAKRTNKRRRRLALDRTERNMATHKAPIGMPFGPGRNARILTADDLADGKPEALPPPPPPDGDRNKREVDERAPRVLNQEDLAKRGEHIESTAVAGGAGGADHSGARAVPLTSGDGEILTADDVAAKNKAKVEEPADDEEAAPEVPVVYEDTIPEDTIPEDTVDPAPDPAPEDEEEEIDEEQAMALMGDQPVDNVVVDALVEKLGDMRKADIVKLASTHDIEIPEKVNKSPLIALVAEGLAKKGLTDIPGE